MKTSEMDDDFRRGEDARGERGEKDGPGPAPAGPGGPRRARKVDKIIEASPRRPTEFTVMLGFTANSEKD